MIEVVFSDSVKGSMTMAKKHDTNKPEKVISYVGFYLDIGDISGAIDGIERREVFSNIWGHIDFDEQESEQFFQMQCEDVEKLLSAAQKGVPIRIWKSNAPFSACGFAFVCNILRKTDCKVSVVSLPEYVIKSNGTLVSYTSWGEVSPEEFYSFLSHEKELSNIEKCVQANLWNDLKIENSPLRAIVNGKLISVPENFYDHLLINNIPEGEFVMSRLIGNILGNYPLGVGDGWFALRINKMIEKNILEVVSHKNISHPYKKLLKRINI